MDQGDEYYKRYLHGDQDAFVSLVQMYMDGLVLFLTGITGDVTLAEDATEDTFVKLGVKCPHYSGKASFKTWLYTIGRNTARDHLRRYVTLAEDATEDTFVKLGVKCPHYSGKASFKTWLYTIGRNTARDHLRRCRRTIPLSPTVTDPLSEGLDPESHYFRKERDRRLHHAMGNLIPSHRQILWLIYFEGFFREGMCQNHGQNRPRH